MSPPMSSTPSLSTLRKREQRARMKQDPEALEKQRQYQREYRARKKLEKEGKPIVAAADTIPMGDLQIQSQPIVNAANEAKVELINKISDTIADVIKAPIVTPGLQTKAVAATEAASNDALIKITEAVSAEYLGQALFNYSTTHDSGDNVIKLKSAVDYAKRMLLIQKMHKALTGEAAKVIDLENFRDVGSMIRTIQNGTAQSGKTKGQPWELSSKLVYIGAISAVLRRIAGFEKVHAEYSKIYKKWHSEYDDIRKQNNLTTSERERFAEWPDVIRGFYKARDEGLLSLRDLALYGLYTLIPPRRVKDYQSMYVVKLRKQEDIDNLSKDKNWLILSKKNHAVKMIINVYKTDKKYGQYMRTTFPDDLDQALQTYIEDDKLKMNMPLFGNNKGELYNPGAFSNIVGKLFEKVLGVRASINILRHSAITHFLSTKRTVKEREDYAREMSHSIALQMLYDRQDVNAPIPIEKDNEDDTPANDAPNNTSGDKAAAKKTPNRKSTRTRK
jgi:hypothetical protein